MKIKEPNRKTEVRAKQQDRKQMVVKANELIRDTKYSLSLMDQKIIAYLISKIRPTDKELQWYEFSIKDFCETCGLSHNSGKNNNVIKKKIEELHNKPFWLLRTDPVTGQTKEILCSWVPKVVIVGRTRMKVKLDEDLAPLLINLKKNYTQYELIYVLPMRHMYSPRLYEICRSILDEKGRRKREQVSFELEVEELHLRLADPYERFADFNRRVLKPAVKEVNLYTDIHIDYDLVKQENKVTDILFTVQRLDVVDRMDRVNTLMTILDRDKGQVKGQMTLDEVFPED